MRLALALFLVSCAHAGCGLSLRPSQVTTFWPDAPRAKFLVELGGDFKAESCHDVHWGSGHETPGMHESGGTGPPPPIPDGHYAALNADRRAAVEDALRGLGLA